jgi:uncharacterized protein with PQ loop repeat
VAYESSILNIADIAQIGITVLNFCAYPAQWRQLIKRKSSADISLSSWVIWLFSCLLAQFYAWTNYLTHGHNFALIVGDTCSLLCVGSTIALILWFKKGSTQSAAQPLSIADGIEYSEIIHETASTELSHVEFDYVDDVTGSVEEDSSSNIAA